MRREHTDELANWEQWPLAALFAANALNVFILYVPLDEMPNSIQWLLPWVKVLCGIAAALSLDGTLISVTMGRRLGRTSGWSWATIVATGIFTAAVAWYVHHAVGGWAAILFMSQAVILVLYGQHLAQPRKTLQLPETTVTKRLETPVLAKSRNASADRVSVPIRENFSCKICGQSFQALTDVSAHARKEHGKKSASVASSIPTDENGARQIDSNEV